MWLMPWECERCHARLVDPQHPRKPTLGPRAGIHGHARQIARRNLPAMEGRCAKRQTQPGETPRARGNGPPGRLGVAPGTISSTGHAGAVRSPRPGLDFHWRALPGNSYEDSRRNDTNFKSTALMHVPVMSNRRAGRALSPASPSGINYRDGAKRARRILFWRARRAAASPISSFGAGAFARPTDSW